MSSTIQHPSPSSSSTQSAPELTQALIESDIRAALNALHITPAQLIASMEDCGCCFDLPKEHADHAKDLWLMMREFIIELAARDDLP